MTVSTTIGYQRTSGDGATTVFAVPFALVEAAQLIVELVHKTTGVVTPQTRDTHYTLAIAADFQSASVTFVTAPPATHWAVRRRQATYTQPTHIIAHGRFPADVVELAIDRLAMDLQALRDTVQRGVRLGDSDPVFAATLPPLSTILGKYLYINGAGEPIGVDGPAGVAISAAMTPVVQGGTLAAALTAFGFSSYIQSLIDETTAAGLVAAAGTSALQQVLGISGGRRQTVLAGPVTSTGAPDFLPASATGLTLTGQNVSASFPLVISAAGGFGLAGPVNRIGATTANPSWVLPDSTTSYLYADIDAAGGVTFGSTTLAPAYQRGGTYSVTNLQNTFNIAEMVMKVGNGSAASQVWRVFLGEATTSGGNITSPGTFAYAYNGDYDTGWIANPLPAAGVNTSKNANLGIPPEFYRAEFMIKNISSEGGYNAGEATDDVNFATSGSQFGKMTLAKTRNTIRVTTGNNGYLITNLSSGALFQPDVTKWEYRIIGSRRF